MTHMRGTLRYGGGIALVAALAVLLFVERASELLRAESPRAQAAAAPPDAEADAPAESSGEEARPAEPTAEEVEFFERRIRPVLATTCAKCHAQGDESEGGLEVTGRERLLEGGYRGAAIVPGRPDESLLMVALARASVDEVPGMPPTGPLPNETIAAFARWIEVGAPWPADARVEGPAAYFDGEVTAEHRQYWAFRPLAEVPLPNVADRGWPQTPIDRFIRAAQEAAGVSPAPPADKRTLIRRLSFDLVGLPPTPEEIAAFLADEAPGAYERLVDRLLASPHYGERWARHWLDLVRFAETNGIDNDYPKPNAFRYRDWAIEAFNDDLPYDQMILEQVAGDLLPEPRISRDGTHYASPLGSAIYWFNEMLNVPVDRKATLAGELENQIDMLGKTFLGLTLACARCHDHKFDPITADDYYALAGMLESSTNEQRAVDTPATRARQDEVLARIAGVERQIADLVASVPVQERLLAARLEAAGQIENYLLGTVDLYRGVDEAAEVDRVASRRGLDPAQLRIWIDALEEAEPQRDPVLYVWARLAQYPSERFGRRVRTLERRLERWNDALDASLTQTIFDDFESDEWHGWEAAGLAFGAGPQAADHLPELTGHRGSRVVSTYRGTDAATGRLTSRPFRVDKRYMTFLIAGGNHPRQAAINLLLNSPVLPEPVDVSATGDDSHRMQRKVFNLQPYMGQEIRIEIVDEVSEGPWGHVVIDQISLLDDDPPPLEWFRTNRIVVGLLEGIESHQPLAARYQQTIVDVLRAWQAELEAQAASGATASPAASGAADPSGPAGAAGSHLPQKWNDPELEELRVWALSNVSPLAAGDEAASDDAAGDGIEAFLTRDEREALDALRQEKARLERLLPRSTIGIASVDRRDARDAQMHMQGNPHELGPEVPRRLPEVLASAEPLDIASGSGRLELARWIAAEENPLAARVLVNRVWQHHFGRGLVPTPDNFGRLGEPPTHPELLDYLSRCFIDSGWSIKALHRLILLSSTYQQSGRVDPRAREVDPANRLWHHRAPLRLEGEAVRDAILACSGRLDRQMLGPSVPTHLTEYMEGEDLPEISGPLDGDGRRSIYLEVRRNHLAPLLANFDFPKPISTVGQREVSLLPSQSLTLLNNELVAQQARVWAARAAQWPLDDEGRIARLVEEALGRPPTADEAAALSRFVAEQQERHARLGESATAARQAAWADLCHVLWNVAEFILVP